MALNEAVGSAYLNEKRAALNVFILTGGSESGRGDRGEAGHTEGDRNGKMRKESRRGERKSILGCRHSFFSKNKVLNKIQSLYRKLLCFTATFLKQKKDGG